MQEATHKHIMILIFLFISIYLMSSYLWFQLRLAAYTDDDVPCYMLK